MPKLGNRSTEPAQTFSQAQRPANAVSLHAERGQPGLELAEVVEVDGRRCRVRSAAGSQDALTAASCLVMPRPGDRVALLRTSGSQTVYIWAVLERAEPGPIGVSAPEGLCVSAPAGAFVVSAERIELISRQRLGMSAEHVDVEAKKLQLTFTELLALGKSALSQVDNLRFAGKYLNSIWERTLQRVQRSYRVVEEIEHVSARQLDMRASENLSLHGKNNLITADELVKLDGKQLHLG